jgi:hypothetical protein
MQVWPFVGNMKGQSLYNSSVFYNAKDLQKGMSYPSDQAKFYALFIPPAVLPPLVSHIQRRRKILFLSQRFTLLYIYRINIYIDSSRHQ